MLRARTTMPRRCGRLAACVVAALLLAVVVGPARPSLAAPSDAELAFHWAPVHYQDTDSTDADADYLTTVDYDGGWQTINNWEDQDDDPGRLSGAVYYSVVETGTHWFVDYAFFHPRDWCDYPLCDLVDSHENDMEGLVMAVRKDGSEFGRLEAMVTIAHTNFYSYVPPGGTYRDGQEDIDGTIVTQAFDGTPDRPTTFQEAKGHGAFAWDGGDFPGGDGVVYYPSRTASEVPANGNDRQVAYRLVNIFDAGGLWERRFNPETFASFGAFLGDDGKDNAANAPWGWDDGDDGSDLQGGEHATDPAKLVAIYFSNLGDFSRDYVRNEYRS
jgi:hypothetical protein